MECARWYLKEAKQAKARNAPGQYPIYPTLSERRKQSIHQFGFAPREGKDSLVGRACCVAIAFYRFSKEKVLK